jgi:hypothetical protein
MVGHTKILPGTGRGTIRRMVEGARLSAASTVSPLHRRFAPVPLPVPGRI